MHIDLYAELPEKIPETGTRLIKNLANNQLTLTPKPRGKTITINRIIDVDEKLGILLGFHVTDGLSSRNSRSYVTTRFTNTDLTIISAFLEAAEDCMGLLRNNFNYVGYHNPKFIKNPIAIGEIWARDLSINKPIIHCVQTKLVKFKLCVENHSVALRQVLDFLSKRILEFSNVRSFAIGFIKAAIAAEGHVSIRGNSLKEVFIAQNTDRTREVIRKVLDSLNLVYKVKIAENRSGIRLMNYPILQKIKDYNLHSISLRKKETFERGLANLQKYHKQGRRDWAREKIISCLSEKPMTVSELAQVIDLKYSTIIEYFSRKRPGVIEKVEPHAKYTSKIGRHPIIWRLKNE